MYAIPWYVILFVSIPEAFLIIILGFALFNIYLQPKHILIVSLIISLVAYFIRKLDIVFGIHTLIGLALMIMLIKIFTKMPAKTVFLPTLSGFVIVATLQSLILPFALEVCSVDPLALATQPWLNIIFFIPEALVMILLYLYIKRHHFFIIDMQERKTDVYSL